MRQTQIVRAIGTFRINATGSSNLFTVWHRAGQERPSETGLSYLSVRDYPGVVDSTPLFFLSLLSCQLPSPSRVQPLLRVAIRVIMESDKKKHATLSAEEVDREMISQVGVGEKSEQLVAPDQFDDNYRTTRNEIWAYYACVCSSRGR